LIEAGGSSGTRLTGSDSLLRRWPWLLLIAFSALLHLWQLGERSYHHDEAIHAQLSYELATEHRYRYNPTFHGPLLYYLTAGTFLATGDSDFTARLPVAVCSLALLWVAWRLRRPFGDTAAWWTGLLFTISPVYLYYGRFLRMDILEVLTASLAALAAYRALEGRRSGWIWLGLWTGLAFATKENAYVTVVLVGVIVVIFALGRGVASSVQKGVELARTHGADLGTAFAVFVLVTVPIYTVGFSFPEDWLFPAKAVSYWWDQHSVQRVAGPWWYYLPRLLQYEFLILGAATVWIVRRGRRAGDLERALFLFGVMSIGMYVYLGEKVPWLSIHQVWPFVPLAGAQLARTMGPEGRWWSRTLAGVGVGLTLVVSVTASFVLDEISPAHDRVESLHYVQTCPEFTIMAREVAATTTSLEDGTLVVGGQAVWPIKWYWRHQSVRWGSPRGDRRPEVVICDPGSADLTRSALGGGFSEQRIPLRAWWLMYQGEPSPTQIVRYFLTRRPWIEVGSTDVVVFRAEGAAQPGR
jgi:uncharacterized protein (TIGR03663 family)